MVILIQIFGEKIVNCENEFVAKLGVFVAVVELRDCYEAITVCQFVGGIDNGRPIIGHSPSKRRSSLPAA